MAANSDSARTDVAEWLSENRDRIWDLVRIYLGFALVVKGFAYLLHLQAFAAMMTETGVPFAGAGLAELVAVAHVAGGLMMAFGILTRLGAAIQIPNLVGAILFVHLREGLFTEGQTLEFSTLVLFLLVIISVLGAGRLSIDYYFRVRRTPAELQPAHA
jgi:putative oxidoreductase